VGVVVQRIKRDKVKLNLEKRIEYYYKKEMEIAIKMAVIINPYTQV
jgi:hypothetical protein